MFVGVGVAVGASVGVGVGIGVGVAVGVTKGVGLPAFLAGVVLSGVGVALGVPVGVGVGVGVGAGSAGAVVAFAGGVVTIAGGVVAIAGGVVAAVGVSDGSALAVVAAGDALAGGAPSPADAVWPRLATNARAAAPISAPAIRPLVTGCSYAMRSRTASSARAVARAPAAKSHSPDARSPT